eukprot:s451_g26.t1
MQVPRATCQQWAAAKHSHIDWDVRVWPECSLQAFATRERFFSALRALSPAAMAETPASLTSTTRPQADLEPHLCPECEGMPPAPEVDGWEATKQIGRTLASLCGGGGETATVATENFHDLHARLISNENVKFAMFKNKVALVVNVATQ